jgi:hypothetical protein
MEMTVNKCKMKNKIENRPSTRHTNVDDLLNEEKKSFQEH